MEQVVKIFIYIHAFFGGISLITGIASILLKKGNSQHKKTGKLFTFAMLVSTLISIPISCLPNHENPFLFLIGLFTIYLVLTGNRALTFKTKEKAERKDIIISGIMLVFSIIALFIGIYGYTQSIENSILYLFFGSFSLYMTIKDFIFYKKRTPNDWLKNHIGKMIGATIASITAFIVAGLEIGSLISWILPSIIGTIYIYYWKMRLKKK
ncbi:MULTISPECIES: hypothetical protein [Flavobacterium]|uniref:DUF2306 domain-containing protein n=1 Tax=Flavobacterium jumunjinense TaxID=998845 RepID=A0ABV5GLF1_9FLAO|nr:MULTISPECIES: hypothetical protein [Flavobacterium]